MAAELPPEARVVVEVPRGGRVKRTLHGRVDYVSPLPSPFNYGSVPAVPGADGEPQDALVLGPPLPVGHTGTWPVHGRVGFVDGGVPDAKWVCGAAPPDAADLRAIDTFFTRYARLKGLWSRLRGGGRVAFLGWEPR